jgi:predicted dehydrogenase
MARNIRVGVVGLTHDHVWENLSDVVASERATLVAAADPHPALTERVRSEHDCAVFDSYEEVLDCDEVDAVYVYANNAEGADLAEDAAKRGLHVLVEKPMAATLEGAERMVAAARETNVRLVVNWPFAWWPPFQHALNLAKEGNIGALWQVKYRSAHEGPKELGCSPYFCEWLYDETLNGAGALMDYCCYGVVLARALLGMPHRVTGVAGRLLKETIPVEDNAVLVLEYPHATAVAEASWTQVGHLTSYITAIYGSEGILLVEPGDTGRLLRATAEIPDGEAIAVPESPPHLRNCTEYFLHCIESGEAEMPLCQDRISRDAQEILEAGILSAGAHACVSIPLSVQTRL